MTKGAHVTDSKAIFLTLNRRHFYIFQAAIPVIFAVLATIHYCAYEFFDPGLFGEFTSLFDVGRESSIPTAISVLNLFLASVLLFVTFSMQRKEKHAFGWLALSIILLALTIDEAASIHEKLGNLNPYTGLEFSFLTENKWVAYGAIFVLAVFFSFIPFLRSIPKRTAGLIILSGIIFVGGALGLEFLGALMLEYGIVENRNDPLYWIRRVFEEGFEMAGIALLNCTLFAFISPNKVEISFA